ncbi:hypothetical protein [Peptoniphilus genitalis]|uniref:Uncharacterized protein n=1 Tax=Peptoniphilus genitalis TaxID=3036303 RepID=A0ABY4TQK2_9FIRM|nr:hypothetical protein [Peptoniphilus sp. SAHP1]URN40884.1 hypothetical protein M9426_06415 [Peptoniphilus sp. SAHP1]
MIKVILIYQDGDNTQEYCEPSYKIIFVKNEEEFWKKYNLNNEYIKCEDELAGTFRVYLKKDKIIEIRIEKFKGEKKK